MGCVYSRASSRSRPNWWIKWIDAYGVPQYRKVGEDRSIAEAALKTIEAEIVARRFKVPTAPMPVPTLAAAGKDFIDRRSAIGKDGQPMRRAWKDDKARVDKYLIPNLGKKHLDEITDADVRALIDKLRPVLKPQSIRNTLAILSRIYGEQPRAMCLTNPVSLLDRADRDAIGPAWDPKATPWLKASDVRAVYLAMRELAPAAPWRAMFAVGTFAGLRTGEVLALEWGDLDADAGTIHVRRSWSGPLKDDESRIAPLPESLAAVLKEWRRICPVGKEQVFPPTGRRGRYVKEHALGKALRAALAMVNAERAEGRLPETMKWYGATRHSFASRYVQAGGSLMKLAGILGHSTAEVTLRYAHLTPGNFTAQERALVDVDLSAPKVIPFATGTT